MRIHRGNNLQSIGKRPASGDRAILPNGEAGQDSIAFGLKPALLESHARVILAEARQKKTPYKLERLKNALAIAKRLDDAALETEVFLQLSVYYLSHKKLKGAPHTRRKKLNQEAIRYAAYAYDNSLFLGDPKLTARSLMRLGHVYVRSGRFQAGLRCFIQAAKTAPARDPLKKSAEAQVEKLRSEH